MGPPTTQAVHEAVENRRGSDGYRPSDQTVPAYGARHRLAEAIRAACPQMHADGRRLSGSAARPPLGQITPLPSRLSQLS